MKLWAFVASFPLVLPFAVAVVAVAFLVALHVCMRARSYLTRLVRLHDDGLSFLFLFLIHTLHRVAYYPKEKMASKRSSFYTLPKSWMGEGVEAGFCFFGALQPCSLCLTGCSRIRRGLAGFASPV